MAPAFGQGWTRGPGYGRRASMRISDAERSAVTDQLSRHYGDGRLDEAEFQQRLDQAMHAKTQADLAGLFDDLPPLDEPADDQARRRRPAYSDRQHRHHPGVLLILLVVVVVATAGQFVVHFWFPWLLAGLVVFLLLRSGGHHHRHYDDRGQRQP